MSIGSMILAISFLSAYLQAQISITLSPQEVTLQPGQTQVFTPTISNTTNQGTSWDQGAWDTATEGTLSTRGLCASFCTNLYTAPGAIAAPFDIAILVGSLADSTQHTFSIVHLVPANTPPPPVSGPITISAYQIVNGVRQDIAITLDPSLTLTSTGPGTATIKLTPLYLLDIVDFCAVGKVFWNPCPPLPSSVINPATRRTLTIQRR